MKVMKFLLCCLLLALPVFAEESEDRQTATSLHYVAHELDTRQDKLTTGTNAALTYTNSAGSVEQRTVKENLNGGTTDTSLPMVNAVNAGLNTKQNDIATIDDHTAVTYTNSVGTIGQKGIYQDTGTYAEQSDNLIDAKTFNAALKNGLDNEFVCTGIKPGTDTCWLWQIHSGVPDGYTQIEYIQSDGTQWIDTGIKLAGTDMIETEFQNTNSTSYGALYGVFAVNDSSALYANTYYYAYDKNNTQVNTLVPVDTNWHKTVHDFVSGRLKIDDTTVNFTPFTFANTVNNYLFARYTNGSYGYYFTGRIKSYKVFRNGELIQHLIPVKQGDVAGMYDMVGGTFKPSSSSTDFTPGPETVYIPQNQ